jgi:acetyltransferase-like isoleucine patch superfamily enzyme
MTPDQASQHGSHGADRFNPLSKDPAEIARAWYVPPKPEYARSWLLYSEELVLQALQGCYGRPEQVRRTGGWKALAAVVRGGMAIAQAVLMLLSAIPVLQLGVYLTARELPRNLLGYFLRGCYWKTRLRRMGVDSIIDQGVDILRPGRVELGSHCHLDKNALLGVGDERGFIILGDHVHVGPSCLIAGRGGVEIGHFASLVGHVSVYAASNLPYHPQRMGELMSMSHTAPSDQQYTTEQRVIIGDYAVIGIGSVVLPGATLGRGCVVHAYSEVSGNFPDFALVSGHGRAKQIGWRRPAKLDPRRKEE